jgi:hypothetical protein
MKRAMTREQFEKWEKKHHREHADVRN